MSVVGECKRKADAKVTGKFTASSKRQFTGKAQRKDESFWWIFTSQGCDGEGQQSPIAIHQPEISARPLARFVRLQKRAMALQVYSVHSDQMEEYVLQTSSASEQREPAQI